MNRKWLVVGLAGAGATLAFAWLLQKRKREHDGEAFLTKTKVQDPPLHEPKFEEKEAPVKNSDNEPKFEEKEEPLKNSDIVKICDIGSKLEESPLSCGLKWERTAGVDMNASCVSYDKEGRHLGCVYFACQRKGEVRHSSDADSPLDCEMFDFCLSSIDPDVHCLFFVVTNDTGPDVKQCSIRLMDATNKTELLKFETSTGGTSLIPVGPVDGPNGIPSGTARLLAMIFRKNGGWHFRAEDKCWQIPLQANYRTWGPHVMQWYRQHNEL